MGMIVLGIETSCDETSAAVIEDGVVRSNIISSQFIHSRYGGVVPELASRAHQQLIVPVVEQALAESRVRRDEIDGVAATYGPGLVGSLLVGLSFGKSLAYGLKKPFVGVNHMEGHLYSNFLEHPDLRFPFLCLVVSGGHTQLVYVRDAFDHQLLGETLDDAAGEAYDKVAKMLGLGFPGGPAIDRLAKDGNPDFVRFPRSYLSESTYDFSFSGIKTSVLYWLRDHQIPGSGRSLDPSVLANVCASFQAAVVDVLAGKTLAAAREYCVRQVCIAGGVSANSELRSRITQLGRQNDFSVYYPGLEYCTDNGAMVGYVGWMKLKRGERSSMETTALANLSL
jgi:N6-L-threonylcarbamoyladenine synthase